VLCGVCQVTTRDSLRLLPRNSTILYAGAHILLITDNMGLLTSCTLILLFSVGAAGSSFIYNMCFVKYMFIKVLRLRIVCYICLLQLSIQFLFNPSATEDI